MAIMARLVGDRRCAGTPLSATRPAVLLSHCCSETAAEPAPTLRWYVEMWRNPLLTGAVVTSMEAAVIVALTTPLLALVAAISNIGKLKLPRLILGLMLPCHFSCQASAWASPVAFFFKQVGIAPSLQHHRHRADSLGLAVRASGRVDGHVDVRSGPNRRQRI